MTREVSPLYDWAMEELIEPQFVTSPGAEVRDE